MTSVHAVLTNGILLLTIGLLPGAGAHAAETGKFIGAETSEPPAWFKQSFLDFEQDVQEAAADDKRIMLYFHQEGCPYCSRLVTENFQQPDIVENMQENLEAIAINMWGDREVVSIEGKPYTEKSLAAALRVNYTPTLIFLNEQGKVALRLNGFYPPEQFRLALDYVTGHKETETSFHDYVAARTTKPAAGALNPEPFFLSPPYALARNVIHAERPLAVFFEQAQCENCDILHERILTEPETRMLIQQFDSVQLDMWSNTPVITPDGKRTKAKAWAKDLDLAYAPSIVFFDRKGKEVMRIDAFLKTFHVQSIFDYVLNEAYLEESSFQRFISARAERLRAAGIDVNIRDY